LSDKHTAQQDSKVNVGTSDQNGHLPSVKADDIPSHEADSARKSKKKKKDKSRRSDQTENCSKDVQPDISSAAGDSSTKPVAKKKKRKRQEDGAEAEVNTVCENGDQEAAVAEDSQHKDKKSAKKHKHSADAHESFEGTDAVNAGDDVCKQVNTVDSKNFLMLFAIFNYYVCLKTCLPDESGLAIPPRFFSSTAQVGDPLWTSDTSFDGLV